MRKVSRLARKARIYFAMIRFTLAQWPYIKCAEDLDPCALCGEPFVPLSNYVAVDGYNHCQECVSRELKRSRLVWGAGNWGLAK